MATEEQVAGSTTINLYSGSRVRFGQRLTISNRTVSKLGFWIWKSGGPTGDVTFVIRKVSDDSIILSKKWGDASSLTGSYTYEEVEFDSPTLINEEVRILVEFYGGNSDDKIASIYSNTDVKASEYESQYISSWTDHATYDARYIYTYTIIAAPTVTTQAVSSIGTTTATGNGNITDNGGEDVSAWGTCLAVTENPDTGDTVDAGSGAGGIGAFTTSITELIEGTHYYVRAYATNSAGTSYGSQVEFNTITLGKATLAGVGTLASIGRLIAVGKATLAGAGTLAALGGFLRYGASTMSGVGTLAAKGARIFVGKATFAGTGILAGIGRLIAIGKASLAGSGTLTAIGSFFRYGQATLSGIGTLASIGRLIAVGKATLAGTGILAAIGQVFKLGAATLAGVGTLSASAVITAIGKATLAGTGTLASIGRLIAVGKTILSGTGTLATIGGIFKLGAATLTGVGTLVASAVGTFIGKTTLSGVGSLVAKGTLARILRVITAEGSVYVVKTAQGSIYALKTILGRIYRIVTREGD